MADICKLLAPKSRHWSRAIHDIGAPRWDDVRRGRLRALSRGVRRDRSVPFPTRAPAARSFLRRNLEGAGGPFDHVWPFVLVQDGWPRSQLPVAGPRRPLPLPFGGSGRRRPDEREPRVDGTDASAVPLGDEPRRRARSSSFRFSGG